MRPIPGLLGVVVGASLVVAAPAAAAAPGDAILTLRALNTSVHVGDVVTATGKLTKVSGGVLANQAVTVNLCQAAPGQAASCSAPLLAKTGDTGVYQARFRVPGLKPAAAFFLTAKHVDAAAARQDLAVTFLTRVHKFGAPWKVGKGKRANVSGRFLFQGSDGKLHSLRDRRVGLFVSADAKKWSASPVSTGRTGSGGSFNLPVRVSKPLYVKVRLIGAVGPFTPGESPARYIGLTNDKTKRADIVDLAHPSQVSTGNTAEIGFRSFLTDSSGRRTPNKYAQAYLEFRKKNDVVWYSAKSAATDGEGRASFHVPFKEDGHWRIVLPGRKYVPRVETEFFVDTKYSTTGRINASPEPVKKGKSITVRGKLTNKDLAPLPGVRVSIYFHAKGSGTWKWISYGYTDSFGEFSKKFKAKKDGSFRFRFWGDAENYRTTSPYDYVDVR